MYVERNDAGEIVGVYDSPQPGRAEEYVEGASDIFAAHRLPEEIRAQRDAKLAALDWLVIRHMTQTAAGANTTLTADEYQELLTYLQALRDLTAQEGFPASVTWPVAPSFVA